MPLQLTANQDHSKSRDLYLEAPGDLTEALCWEQWKDRISPAVDPESKKR